MYRAIIKSSNHYEKDTIHRSILMWAPLSK